MEPFKMPGKNTRLVKHKETVYKIKLVYVNENNQSDESLPCDVETMHCEIEEVIRVILNGGMTPVKTDHFIVYPERKQWQAASLLIFTENGKHLETHPFMLTLNVRAREDLGHRPADNHLQLLQVESARHKEQEYRMAKQPSPSLIGSRKHDRHFVVTDDPSLSTSQPKKQRLPDKRSANEDQELPKQADRQPGRGEASAGSGQGHRRYLLRRGSRKPQSLPLEGSSRERISINSDPKASDNKDRTQSDALNLRPRKGETINDRRGTIGYQGSRTRQGGQESHRDELQPGEAEPVIGATVGPEAHPAYPEGGVHHMDIHVRQPRRRNGDQFQHAEQMRLQKLAGNPQIHQPASAQYQLRRRGAFGRIVHAVLTPVKNLFAQ